MRSFLWAIAMAALFFGCASKYRIMPRQDDVSLARPWDRSTEPIAQTWEQIKISVRPVPSNQTPSWVRRNYTVFDVTVENLSNEEITVRLDQFALVDSHQVQRSPLPPEEADRAVGRYVYPRSQFSFGFGISSGFHHHSHRHFGYGYRYYDAFPVYVEGNTTYLQAFHGGPIVPYAKSRGWLLFEQVDEYAGNQLDFYFLAEGKIRLVFPFEVAERP